MNTNDRHAVDQQPEINRPADAPKAFEEFSFELKTTAEIPIFSKTARVVEEVVISKETTERAQTVRDSIKSTDVTVEKIDTDEVGNRRNG